MAKAVKALKKADSKFWADMQRQFAKVASQIDAIQETPSMIQIRNQGAINKRLEAYGRANERANRLSGKAGEFGSVLEASVVNMQAALSFAREEINSYLHMWSDMLDASRAPKGMASKARKSSR
jgi:hypothetical protein